MKTKLPTKTLLAAALGLGIAAMTTTTQSMAADCPADAICRNDEAPGNYNRNGPYRVSNYKIADREAAGGATVYYPANAEPPFASLVFCPPFTGVQYMYSDWGPLFFLYSHSKAPLHISLLCLPPFSFPVFPSFPSTFLSSSSSQRRLSLLPSSSSLPVPPTFSFLLHMPLLFLPPFPPLLLPLSL